MDIDKGEVKEGFGVVKEDWVDENTCLRGEGNYENGWREGKWVWFDDKNQPVLFGEYLQGDKTGVWYGFDSDGFPQSIQSYKDGELHGWGITYLPSGEKMKDFLHITNPDSPVFSHTKENPTLLVETLWIDGKQIQYTEYIGKVFRKKYPFGEEGVLSWESLGEEYPSGEYNPVYPTPVYEDIRKEWGV